MGTLAVSFGVFCLCMMATPEDKSKVTATVAWVALLAGVVFVARVLGFVVERWGW